VSTPSVIAAVQAKFAALTAGGFPGAVVPTLYFDEAPQTNAAGAQVQPTTAGYAVLKDKGSTSKALAFGLTTRELIRLDFEFYYPSLGDCRMAAFATALNGGTEADKLGFDYGTLPDLTTPYVLLAMKPRSNKAKKAGTGKTSAPVHYWSVSYELELIRN
jgi:hypothetical protein